MKWVDVTKSLEEYFPMGISKLRDVRKEPGEKILQTWEKHHQSKGFKTRRIKRGKGIALQILVEDD